MVSVLSGYCLAYLLYAVAMAVMANDLLLFFVMLLGAVFTPIIVIPLSIINLVIGYPIFKLILGKLHFQKPITLAFSFSVSSILCAILYEIGRDLFSRKGIADLIGDVSIALIFGCFLAAILSSLIYWYIEIKDVGY